MPDDENAGGSNQNKHGTDSEKMIKNEMLCYMYNKIDVIPHDILLKICMDFYSDEEIEEAKSLLYNTCSTTIRQVQRKGNKKREMNINDMISVLHKAESMPVYVACDLSRLPPLDFNNIDITSMSQDIKRLKADISGRTLTTEPTVVKEIDSLKSQMIALQSQVGELVTHIKESCRPTCTQPLYADIAASDGPDGAVVQVAKKQKEKKVVKSPCSSPQKACLSSEKKLADGHQPVLLEPQVVESKTDKQSSVNTGLQGEGTKEEPITLVGPRKRSRQRDCVVGTSGMSSSFGLMGHKNGQFVSLFISRLKPETNVNVLQTFIKQTFKCELKCEKLATRFDSYASFRAEGFCKDRTVFYNTDKWPQSILVRRYFKPKS